jgi:hypothetical protein
VTEKYRQRVGRDLWVVLDSSGEITLQTDGSGRALVIAPSLLVDELNSALTAAITQRELLQPPTAPRPVITDEPGHVWKLTGPGGLFDVEPADSPPSSRVNEWPAWADADLADAVCRHVEHQPWGRCGNDPVPVEIWYHTRANAGHPAFWVVRFVVAVKGSTRKFGRATGPTLREALTAARAQQTDSAS